MSTSLPSANENTVHLMKILREAMLDPALSGGCPFLAELFTALAGEESARALLDEIPGWKIPGLLLSAALNFRALANSHHPLAPYLSDSGIQLGTDPHFREAIRRALEEQSELADLVARHTYQCNPPRRMAVSLITAAAATAGWESAFHIDVGTASGIGLLLGEVEVDSPSRPLSSTASLKFPIELRGEGLDLGALKFPRIQKSVGIDLDPPDLRDANCLAWMRACQYPNRTELAYFDAAVNLLLQKNPRIERGSAIDLLPRLAGELPPGQPLLVTDSYVTLFMSEEDRERFRCELDAVALTRPVVWVSNNTLVPAGLFPDRTTAGTAIPPELIERNRQQIFGVVCVTTWPGGKRTPRIVGISHPGACWLEWRPDLAG